MGLLSFFFFFFFFSSRRRHTRFDCDWSSDVCSSDLRREARAHPHPASGHGDLAQDEAVAALDEAHDALAHGAERDDAGDADRDPGDRERVTAKESQHPWGPRPATSSARTTRSIDSPRGARRRASAAAARLALPNP